MSGENLSYSNQQSDQEHLRLLAALRESEILRELGELLASSLNLEHILQVLVKRTAEVCEVERCTVWLLEERSGILRPATYHLSSQHISSAAIQAADSIWYRSSLSFQDPVIQRFFKEKGILFIADLHTIPSLRAVAETFLVRSVFLIALVREGRPVGMMSLDNPDQSYTFSAEQQQLVRAIGQQAAIAIDNARLYQRAEEERRRAEHLIDRARAISQVALTVNSGEDLPTALAVATRYLITGLYADGGAIMLLNDNSLQLASEINLQQDTGNLQTTAALPDLSNCSLVATTGVPLFVKTEQVEADELRWFRQLGLENTLIVPLMVGTKSRQETSSTPTIADAHCVGLAFVTYHDCNFYPSRGQLAFAQDIAAQCALAIEKARLLADARQAAELATERVNTLDAVFQAMNEGITVIDRKGQVLVSNNAASKFLGVSLNTKELLTTWLQRFPVYTLHGQPVTEEDFPISRALRGERIRGERFATTRSDGSQRVIEVNVTPLLDSTKEQIGLVSAFRDITQQMRVEQRIRHALETMLHVAEAVSGITDIKEILRSVLSMTMTTLNCDRGMVQLYDQEKHVFTPLLSLGFSPEVERQWLIDQDAWLNPTSDHYHGFQTQLMEGHATLVSADQFQAQQDQPGEFGNLMILAAPITHSNHLHGLILLDRSQSPANGIVQPASRHDSHRHEFSVWDMAIIEGIAQLAGLAVEQARWQQEALDARTSEAAMREANTLKDEFLAITAHEFRTPLTVILAHCQMALRALRKATGQEQSTAEFSSHLNENLSTIEEQTHLLTNIVNSFLEVTQINRGQLTLKLEEVDVANLAQQVTADHSATSTAHTITCSIEQAERPYIVMGDSARLQQIIANLVHNAIKYSPLGGPVTVSLRQCINGSNKAVIEVRVEDKGIGIPKDAQTRLFERFYRAPNIHGDKTRGIGLGLYIVAQLLRMHRGTIAVESNGNLGEGSRFIFTLPMLER
jgi:PAS domain S-box-containing protein